MSEIALDIPTRWAYTLHIGGDGWAVTEDWSDDMSISERIINWIFFALMTSVGALALAIMISMSQAGR